jgi:hypothetical protein
VIQPATFDELLSNLNEFPSTEYSTCVIDTADAMEDMIHSEVCKKNGWESIEDAGFGKGYNMATERFLLALASFDRLIEQGIQVIVLAHSLVRNFSNPSGADYSRYELTLFKGSNQPGPAPILKAWTDCLLFACYADTAKLNKQDQGSDEVLKRGKGVTGTRVLKTEHAAAWDAKNRLGLPPEIPLSYEAFIKGIAGSAGVEPSAKVPVVPPPEAETTPEAPPVEAAQPAHSPTPAVAASKALSLKDIGDVLLEFMRITKLQPPEVTAKIISPCGAKNLRSMPAEDYPKVLELVRGMYPADASHPVFDRIVG